MSQIITRLAPSPTGYLHLGNAWSFLICWLAARSQNGKVILRMDDIDPQRSKPEYALAIIEDLKWLGLDWDYGPDQDDYIQSKRLSFYETAIKDLEQRNLVYPCFCTRKELQMLASAPHLEDNTIAYPGICASLDKKQIEQNLTLKKTFTLRLRCPGQPVKFYDLIYGQQTFTKERYGGDFGLKRSDNTYSYQLAAAVDDGLMGVNLVIRGRDLLSSTPRQIVLMRYLGYNVPQYCHHPLLLSSDGERLAKRHKSLSLSELRAKGIKSWTLTGILARLAGINPTNESLAPKDLITEFNLAQIPTHDVQMSDEDLKQLL